LLDGLALQARDLAVECADDRKIARAPKAMPGSSRELKLKTRDFLVCSIPFMG